MTKFKWLLVALVALGLTTATACGKSDGNADKDTTTTVASDAGSGDDGGSADPGDGFITGTPEEWLAAVCGDDAEITETDSDIEPRYGPDATSSHYCTPPAQPDGNDTYPEAVLFSADPSADWESFDDPEVFKSFAIGQVSDDEWALVYEDNSTHEIAEPHVAGLTEFGFTVYENNEPVS
ncbi:MAG TPA: hypothetical protein VNS19_23145 [Acidimicrobiales bacterium]|nr:hypothetical protein [Acidimicrobiales bacterium]